MSIVAILNGRYSAKHALSFFTYRSQLHLPNSQAIPPQSKPLWSRMLQPPMQPALPMPFKYRQTADNDYKYYDSSMKALRSSQFPSQGHSPEIITLESTGGDVSISGLVDS